MSFLDSQWQGRLELLLAAGRSAGAELVEIFLERFDRLSVLAEQERVTSVSPSLGCGAGIRVFHGEANGFRDGFVSTTDLSEAGLFQALDQALGMLGLERGGQSGPSFAGLAPLRDYGSGKQDWLVQCPGVQVSADRLL
ncbi:PmbA/TldA family metallopeptidase, partial [uncultured Synechococcus sp.]